MSLKMRVQKMLENRKVADQQAEGSIPFNTFGTDDEDDEESQLGHGGLVANGMIGDDLDTDYMPGRELGTFRNEAIDMRHNHAPLYGTTRAANHSHEHEQYQPPFYTSQYHHHGELYEESSFTIPKPMDLQHQCQHKHRSHPSSSIMLPGPTPEPTSFNTITPNNNTGNLIFVKADVQPNTDAIIPMETTSFCAPNGNNTGITGGLVTNYVSSIPIMSVVSTPGAVNENDEDDEELPPPPPPSVISDHPYVIATTDMSSGIVPMIPTMPALKDFSTYYGYVPEVKPMPTTINTLSNFFVQPQAGSSNGYNNNTNANGTAPLKSILVNRSSNFQGNSSNQESTPITPGASSVTFNLEPIENVPTPLLLQTNAGTSSLNSLCGSQTLSNHVNLSLGDNSGNFPTDSIRRKDHVSPL